MWPFRPRQPAEPGDPLFVAWADAERAVKVASDAYGDALRACNRAKEAALKGR